MTFSTLYRRRVLAAAFFTVTGVAACGGGGGSDADPEVARANDPMPAPNAQMQAVLDALADLGGRPVNLLTVAQARSGPSVADAVRLVLTKQGRSTAPQAVASVVDRTIAGPGGSLAIRIYTPAGTGPFPVALYIHGGGWVIATIDTYDSSARAVANAAGAIVVSTEYRHAPEFTFPAAHDDTYAAYKWTLANAASIGGIARQVAVVGESAGGNMAASIALRSRDDGIQQPVHQALIYPVTDSRLDFPSQQQNRDAKPLNTASLQWFLDKYVPVAADAASPYFSVLRAPSLAKLASATVITADVDPLRSEGYYYARRLSDAGVAVDSVNVAGVTHEFFGTGAVVDVANDAVARVGRNLKAAFTAAGT